MNVARLNVVITGSAAGALAALKATQAETKRTASFMGGILNGVTAAALAGFKVLAAQAAIGIGTQVAAAFAPLIGLVGLLPGLLFAGAAAAVTLKLGLHGVSDAMSIMTATTPAQVKAATAALNKLAPAARSFVLELKNIKPAWDQMQRSVQQSLFDGLAGSVKSLANTYIPIMRTQLSGLASDLRAAAQEAVGFATSSSTVSAVTGMLENVRHAFANLRPAVTPILSALRDVASVSTGFLPGLATGLAQTAQHVADLIRKFAESGRLHEFIQNGIDAAKEFGHTLANVGGILHSVLSAGRGNGGGLLETLQKVTGAVNTFLKSADGKSALNDFFRSTGQAVHALLPVITTVISGISKVAPVLANIAKAAAPGIVAVLKGIGQAFAQLAPAGTQLGAAFGKLLASLQPAFVLLGKLMSSTIVPAIAKAFNTLGTALGPMLKASLPLLAKLLATIIPLAAKLLADMMPLVAPILRLANAFAGLLVSAEPLIAAIVSGLVPVIGVLAKALLDSQPAITSMINSLVQCVPAVTALLEAIIPFIPVLLNEFAPVLADVAAIIVRLTPALQAMAGWVQRNSAALQQAESTIGQFLGGLYNIVGWIDKLIPLFDRVTTGVANFMQACVNAWHAVTSWVSNTLDAIGRLPGDIMNFFSNAGTWLLDAGRNIVMGLVHGIESMASAPWNAVKSMGSGLIDNFKGLFGIHSPSRVMAGLGVFLAQGLAGGITRGAPMVGASWRDVSDLIALQSPSFNAGQIASTGRGMAASPAAAGTVIQVTNHFATGTSAADRAAIDAQVRQSLDAVFAGGKVAVRQSRG